MSTTEVDRLAGRSVIITGAAAGFGRLVAERLAERGAHVIGADVDGETLEQVFTALETAGGSVAWQPTDVTDLAQMRRLAEVAIDRFESIDVLVNNAGTMPLAFFADHESASDAWSRAIDINIKGVVNGIAAVHDQMLTQGRGQVVNVSSTYSNAPTEGSGVYGATKTAVNVLSESLRVESQGKIKVSIVRPTGVPATGLGASVVNPRAVVGMLGHHGAAASTRMQQLFAHELPPELADPDRIGYFALEADHVADTIVYVIDQPWGVSISDITVRASGEPYLL